MKTTIEIFVTNYYQALDTLAPLEKLQSFFDQEGFKIIEGDMLLDSFEKYAAWYENTKALFPQREHTINSLTIKEDEDGYNVLMDMSFQGIKVSEERVHVNADIYWRVITNSGNFYIKRYEVNLKP